MPLSLAGSGGIRLWMAVTSRLCTPRPLEAMEKMGFPRGVGSKLTGKLAVVTLQSDLYYLT